jgi:hypothetical protein
VSSTVQADFGRIAQLPESRCDHNRFYHPMLLRELGSEPIGDALHHMPFEPMLVRMRIHCDAAAVSSSSISAPPRAGPQGSQ